MAPKTAMRIAPPKTRTVPPSDHRVNGSPSMMVAHIELNTNPDFSALAREDLGGEVVHSYSLQGREDGQREGRDLYSATGKVADDEHEHTELRPRQ